MKTYISLLIFVVSLLTNSSLFSQTFFSKPNPDSLYNISVKYLHPFLKENNMSHDDILSGNFQLNVGIPLSEELNLSFNLPIITYTTTKYHFNYTQDYQYISTSIEKSRKIQIGNLSFELDLIDEDKTGGFTFGLTIPTRPKNIESHSEAIFNGTLTDITDVQKYLLGACSLNLAYYKNWFYDDGSAVGLEVGPSGIFVTSGKNSSLALIIRYNFCAAYYIDDIMLRTELNGIYALPIVFYNTVSLGIGLKGYFIKPIVFYQIPLNSKTNQVISGILGIKLEMSF